LTWRMEFEETLQKALKQLRESLKQCEAQIEGYSECINRLTELRKSVPSESKVLENISLTIVTSG
jgi:hypothetical protein